MEETTGTTLIHNQIGISGTLGIFPGEVPETDHQEDGEPEEPTGTPDGEVCKEAEENHEEDHTGRGRNNNQNLTSTIWNRDTQGKTGTGIPQERGGTLRDPKKEETN